MSALVLTAIATDIASLERLVDTPVGPLGYGSDISCTRGVDEHMSETDPNSVEGLAQSIIRRLDCRRGGLPGEPDYGIQVADFLNRGVTQLDVVNVAGEIRGEAMADDRVENVIVEVTLGSGGL